MFSHSQQFDPAQPAWADLPTQAAVFALFAADPNAEPYISRTPNLRNRLRRLLDPRPDQSRRLRLAQSVARIEYSPTGSEFEAWLLLYAASLSAFGDRARKRLHLRHPVLLRMAMENPYPRVYVTNRVTKKASEHLFGPWPSRIAAENFLESMLNLFLLRRCVDELHPDPAFPGCVYSEMKKCLAPCFQGCTDARYAEESAAVHAFLATHGQSLITDLARQRDEASTALDFEHAADLHARLAKVESAAALMPPAVHSLDHLSGLIIQPSAEPEQVSLFLLTRGSLAGPVPYSVTGMRLHNEQSGSSSLYTQPMALQPVPLDEAGAPAVKLAARDELESRLDEALTVLEECTQENQSSTQQTADHLSLFARWYYRPQTKRIGEVCFTQPDGELPKRAILRAISRVYSQNLTSQNPERQTPPAESSNGAFSGPSSTDTSATSGPSGQSSA
jgi:excinuclease ABC subunit C